VSGIGAATSTVTILALRHPEIPNQRIKCKKYGGIEVADQIGSPGELVLILVTGPTSWERWSLYISFLTSYHRNSNLPSLSTPPPILRSGKFLATALVPQTFSSYPPLFPSSITIRPPTHPSSELLCICERTIVRSPPPRLPLINPHRDD